MTAFGGARPAKRAVCGALGVFLAASLGAASARAQPPIVKPGAPGEGSKAITAEESVKLGETGWILADAHFMQDMIVHHAQAVEMVALIPDRSTHEGVALMGKRISLTQAAEIDRMKTWLTRRGQPTTSCLLADKKQRKDCEAYRGHGTMQISHKSDGGMAMDHGDGGHAGHDMGATDEKDRPLMHGMLSPRQMDALAAASGTDFDRLFLAGMIQHHQGALDMVEMLMQIDGAGEDADLSEFLSAVIADQSAEILRMQVMLSELPVG